MEKSESTLPAGQRESSTFYRFGLTPFAKRFPREIETIIIRLCGEVTEEKDIENPFDGLARVSQQSDFHCVTTWSVRGLLWEGVRFKDFYQQVILPQVAPNKAAVLVALKAQDGARTAMLLEDLLDPSVLLADKLNGEPLNIDHGAPLRLVAPKHYGYKSVKYLREIKFVMPEQGYRASGFEFMDHPRARVALEERGRIFPGRLLRYLYRPLIGGTVKRFAKASALHSKNSVTVTDTYTDTNINKP